jgi:hypothetical protein
MMLASYVVGRYKHPIGYDMRRIVGYFVAAMALWGVGNLIAPTNAVAYYATRVLLLAAYIAVVYLAEFRLKKAK